MQIKDKIDVKLIQKSLKRANHNAEESSQTKHMKVLFPELSIMNWVDVNINVT